MKTLKLFTTIALLFTTQTLHAQGILLVQQETRDGKSSTNQIQIDKTRMRAESQASGERAAFLFDATTQVARLINFDKKTYTEITKAQLEQMGQQMSAMQKQMDEQMKNMPPEQRAMVEQMMRGRGGMPGMPGMGAAAQMPRMQYRQTGSDKVGQWACTKYEAMRGQEKVSELCAVDPKEFGLTPADFEVAKQFAEFLRTLMPQGGEQAVVYGTNEDQGFSGIPVRRSNFAGGKVISTTEIKEFRRETFPASTFDVPAGFTKQSIGMRQ